MAVKIRRTYKGAATSAVIDSAGVTSATQTSVGLNTSPADWPSGKFFVVAAPGTSQEEKMCVTISGSVLTVVDPAVSSVSASVNGRGVDDTTARSTISAGAVVYPVFTAIDANEANELTSTYANQGGIVFQGASTFTQLAIGTAGQVLKVNSGATAPEWGAVPLADNSVTSAKIAVLTNTTPKTADFTLASADRNTNILCDKSTEIIVTVPLNSSVSLPVGYQVSFVQIGAGQVTFSGASGVTINSDSSKNKIATRYSAASLIQTSANVWVLFGHLAA